MSTKDIVSELNVAKLTDLSFASAATAAQSSVAFDTKGKLGFAFYVMASRAIGTDVVNVKIQECDTSGGTYTDVADASFLPQAMVSGKTLVDTYTLGIKQPIGAQGTKQFVKLVVTPSAALSSALTLNIDAVSRPVVKPAVDFKPDLYKDSRP